VVAQAREPRPSNSNKRKRPEFHADEAEFFSFLEENENRVVEQLFWLEVNATCLEVDAKKETILTIFIKLQQLCDFIQLSSLSHTTCELGFFKTEAAEVARLSPLVKELLFCARESSGRFRFNLVEACNRLSLDPLDLLSQVKKLYRSDGVSCQLSDACFCFKFTRAFSRAELAQALSLVAAEVEAYEQITLKKIDFVYVAAKCHSYPSVQFMLTKVMLTCSCSLTVSL